jgi:hypothetical protein
MGTYILAGAILLFGFQIPRLESAAPDQYGLIVVAGRPAELFHLRQGDTLPEVLPEHVPSSVREATARAAGMGHYDTTCSRFFDAKTEYVVLLRGACRKGVEVDDGEGLAAFTRTGMSVANTIPALTAKLYLDLQPSERLSRN